MITEYWAPAFRKTSCFKKKLEQHVDKDLDASCSPSRRRLFGPTLVGEPGYIPVIERRPWPFCRFLQAAFSALNPTLASSSNTSYLLLLRPVMWNEMPQNKVSRPADQNSATRMHRRSHRRCRPCVGRRQEPASHRRNASTLLTASWWQSSQVTESERTPFSRMPASVIGGPRLAVSWHVALIGKRPALMEGASPTRA
jgi:hypothetical protein